MRILCRPKSKKIKGGEAQKTPTIHMVHDTQVNCMHQAVMDEVRMETLHKTDRVDIVKPRQV